MEPGVREYLTRILNTIFVVLFWLAINSTAGIMFGYAFIQERIVTGNIIFYCWFIISFTLLLRWVLRLWSKPINFDEP
ncbi:MAG: hypothetical protein Q8K64_02870 [Sediminibacterium sp.]|nr:hypothetical protein [Sediminibacterium sp.]